ncbi:MAG: glycosyltransferase [Deltaproteobacteria bacterium]|nr:glycosyltransferase [Deltaproteobacteria bacterium]
MPGARLSIAMTTYNGTAYIREQLESFAAQTRPPHELVVCDDVSSDDTVAQLEAFAARAPFPVRIERNPTNLTTTPNFAKAIGLCSGDVIFLSDQDDVWLPGKLAAMGEVFDAEPAVGAAICNGTVCNEALEAIGHDLWGALWFHARERRAVREGRATEVFAKHVVASGNTLAFRSRYRDLVLPFPDLHDCADAWIAFLIASVAEFRLVEQPLIRYRVHGKNQFGTRRPGLREQIQRARWQISSGLFAHAVRLFTAIEERLRNADALELRIHPGTLELVGGRIAHFEVRDAMPGNIWQRLPQVAREIRSGAYWHYSYGVKSIAQDLLLR